MKSDFWQLYVNSSLVILQRPSISPKTTSYLVNLYDFKEIEHLFCNQRTEFSESFHREDEKQPQSPEAVFAPSAQQTTEPFAKYPHI